MPLGATDKRILRRFEAEYGAQDGKRAYYASINAGRVRNTPEARRMMKQRRRARRRMV